MTNSDKKDDAPIVQTRTPKKKVPGIFDNLRRLPAPHPVEEIMGLTPAPVPQSPSPSPAEEDALISTAVPQYRSTAVPESLPDLNASESIDPEGLITAVPRYHSTAVPHSPIPTREFYKKSNTYADRVERTLTPAESKVLEQLLRFSVGFNRGTCQVRISVLMERTGYTSDKTVRSAIRGLELKGCVERLSSRNSPLGDEYRILPYSGNTGVPEYRSTEVENTAVLESKVTGELKTNIKTRSFDDDEAYAALTARFEGAVRELTGKGSTPSDADRWGELGELLVAELQIAAARAGSVSNVPAFLTEHLRRRLWKKDKAQLAREEVLLADDQHPVPKLDVAKCPDCFGAGMYYPEGFERGVAKCRHENLTKQAENDR